MNQEELTARLTAAIDKEKFGHFQMRGFMADPRLALLAGAAIGYGVGLEEAEKHLADGVQAVAQAVGHE